MREYKQGEIIAVRFVDVWKSSEKEQTTPWTKAIIKMKTIDGEYYKIKILNPKEINNIYYIPVGSKMGQGKDGSIIEIREGLKDIIRRKRAMDGEE